MLDLNRERRPHNCDLFCCSFRHELLLFFRPAQDLLFKTLLDHLDNPRYHQNEVWLEELAVSEEVVQACGISDFSLTSKSAEHGMCVHGVCGAKVRNGRSRLTSHSARGAPLK